MVKLHTGFKVGTTVRNLIIVELRLNKPLPIGMIVISKEYQYHPNLTKLSQ